METLTNESESEETVPVVKSIFKRPASSSTPGFDVSLNESNSENAQLNNSDTSLTISAPKKSNLFDKARKPSQQHNFSVNFDESNINSETEATITVDFLKPKLPFKRKAASNTSNVITNQFDVTFNETNANVSDKSSLEGISTDGVDESSDTISLATKSNPFKKPKQPSKNMFNIEFDETNTDDTSTLSTTLTKVMFKKKVENSSDQFQVSFNETNNDLVSEPTDKTENKLSQEDVTNEKEIFSKPANKSIKDAFNVEYEESDFGENSEVTSSLTSSKCVFRARAHSSQNFEVSFSPTMPQIAPSSSSSSSQEQKSRDESVIDNDSEMNSAEESCHVESSIDDQRSSNKSVTGGDSEMVAADEDCQGTDAENSKESFTNNSKHIPQENDDERSEVLNEEQQEERQSFEPKTNLENLSFNKSLVNLTNRSSRSEMYLDQSSVNDENLNTWMSDPSDDEIQPPTVPTIPRNATFTEEVPQAVKPVSPTQTCTMTWEQKFNDIISKKKNQLQESNHMNLVKVSQKTKTITKPKPDKGERDEQKSNRTKPPKLAKPAYFATKRLYQYIIRKLEPKFGIDTLIQSEQIVLSICDTVKKVERRKSHQKKLIQDLKKEMASVGLIETTVDFYEFVIKFLPDSFRVKVIPCVQPVTNTVFPPKDTINPFDKIL